MKSNMKRGLSLLLAAMLVLTLLPVQLFAAGGWFYLTVETASGLVFPPERLYYESGQTVKQALEGSKHTFEGLSQGTITAVDGQNGNFTRSDENGSYDLEQSASGIQYFCLTERLNSCPSKSLQALIAALADYAEEKADVKAAAKTPYENALEQYSDAADGNDALALTLAEAITDAIEAYRNQVEGDTYTVTFSDKSGLWKTGDTLYAENAYGLSFEDADGVGALTLPAGEYTFKMEAGGVGASGSISVPAQGNVTVSLPENDLLVQDSLKLSGSGGAEFDESLFEVTGDGDRCVSALIPDTYAGKLYAYWDYDESQFSGSYPSLYAIYTPFGGEKEEQAAQTLKSNRSFVSGALSTGAVGNQIIYRLCMEDSQGFTLFQDTVLTLHRSPSLKALAVTDASGEPQTAQAVFDPAVKEYTYQILSDVDTVLITPEAFGTEKEGYALKVDGNALPLGESVQVTLRAEEDTSVPVSVLANGQETVYTLTFQQISGIAVNIRAQNVSVQVFDALGQPVPYVSHNETTGVYRYRLAPETNYSYVATADTYFHATRSFETKTSSMTLTASVKTENGLSALALGNGASSENKGALPLSQAFDPAVHEYQVTLPDTEPTVYLWLSNLEETAAAQVSYERITSTQLYDGKEYTLSIASGKAAGTLLKNLLMANSGYGNQVKLTLSQQDGEVTYSQDYFITLRRELSLKALSAQCMEQDAILVQQSGDSGYKPTVREYIVTLPAAADSLELTGVLYTSDTDKARYQDNDVLGYHWAVNGKELASGEQASVSLTGTAEAESILITVTCDFAPEVTSEYRITVQKAAPVSMTVNTVPEDALLFLVDNLSGQRVWAEDGAYAISDGFTYDFALTAAGYKGISGEITTVHDEKTGALQLQFGDTIWETAETAQGLSAIVTVQMEKAPENTSLHQTLPSQWADFRGTSYDENGNLGGSAGTNNAIINAKTPVSAEDGTLYWANALGTGFDSEAVGCPLLVDGDLITYAGKNIYRVDTISGEVKAQGTMERTSSFSITPPTYAKGMIFVALSDGTVQAFDAVTLTSLWVYHDPLKGQPNSPIAVCGDYLYTGFWRSEVFDANFVCLSITDEDPTQTNEEKTACWRYQQKGGFYWAGAYVCENYLLVGTDDGKSGYTSETGNLLLLDPKTGALLDKWSGLQGDVRSSICYDDATDSFCFTSKGGCFYQVKATQTADGFALTDKKTLALDNGGNDPQNPPMSTSTPVVYNGRAYVGVAGTGQFTAYSGHNLTVIDLASMRIAYSVPTMGYVQTSGVLTTAYEESGYVYVYFFENYQPGRLRVLRDKPGQKKADYVTIDNGNELPYVLFTPVGEQSQYIICSPVVDENGVFYFKNDSGCLMAYGPSVTLELTKAPDKTAYAAGETFDPAGMQVTLVYANGQRRDVTAYMQYNTDPLGEGDSSITLRFPYTLYHDEDTENGRKTGVTTQTPNLQISITVSGETPTPSVRYGDLNDDGVVSLQDVLLLQQYVAKRVDAEKINVAAADLNGDGVVSLQDVLLLQQYVAKRIDRFPVEQ